MTTESNSNQTHDSRVTYTVEEAGRLLGISRHSAFEAVRRGDIPVIRIGRRLLVPRVQFEALLEGRVDDDG